MLPVLLPGASHGEAAAIMFHGKLLPFPAFGVAQHAPPTGTTAVLECLLHGAGGFRGQHHALDQGTTGPAEGDACVDHPGVVEHEQGTLRQLSGKVVEVAVLDVPRAVDQHRGRIPISQWMLRNGSLRQLIAVFGYGDGAWVQRPHQRIPAPKAQGMGSCMGTASRNVREGA